MNILEAMGQIKKGKTMISPTGKEVKFSEINNCLMTHDENNCWIYLVNGLNRVDIEGEWRFKPRSVSLNEAMKAVRDGYTVRCYPENDGGYIEFNEADSLQSVASSWTNISWGSFLAANWTIEN